MNGSNASAMLAAFDFKTVFCACWNYSDISTKCRINDTDICWTCRKRDGEEEKRQIRFLFMVSSKHTIGIHQHGDIFPARTQLTFMFKKWTYDSGYNFIAASIMMIPVPIYRTHYWRTYDIMTTELMLTIKSQPKQRWPSTYKNYSKLTILWFGFDDIW